MEQNIPWQMREVCGYEKRRYTWKLRSYYQLVYFLKSFANFRPFYLSVSHSIPSILLLCIDLTLGYLYSLGKTFSTLQHRYTTFKTHPVASTQSFRNCDVKVFYIPKLLPVLGGLNNMISSRAFTISLPR